MKKIIYIYSLLISLLLLQVSCNKEEVPENQKGTLEIDLSIADLPDLESITTRSGDELAVNDFIIEIKGDNYNQKWNTYKAFKQQGILELMPGSYTVIAKSSETIPVESETPVYYGESQVTINTTSPATAEVECLIGQIRIQVDVTDIKDIINNLTVGIRIGDNGNILHSFVVGSGITDERYFLPDEELQLVLTGTHDDLALGTLGIFPLKNVSSFGEIKAHRSVKIKVSLDPALRSYSIHKEEIQGNALFNFDITTTLP